MTYHKRMKFYRRIKKIILDSSQKNEVLKWQVKKLFSVNLTKVIDKYICRSIHKKGKLTIFVYTSLGLAENIVKVESVDICLLLPCHPAWGSRVDATHINSYKQKNTFLVQWLSNDNRWTCHKNIKTSKSLCLY